VIRLSTSVESARLEWDESHRRLGDEPGDRRHQLLEQVDAVTDELRRRVGATFTLAELAAHYAGAERWSREAVEATEPPPGWPRTLALVEGAAFHLFSRGAVDYTP
jgi:hypothetical protein